MFQPEFENEINNPLTITSLPPELIELVSVSLDMNSFLLMRFTCQLFCNCLEQELLRRIENSKPKQIAVGDGYLIVLYEDGTVSERKIDINDPKSISIATCNMEQLSDLPKIVQVAANDQNRFYLDVNGNVWCANNSNRNNMQIEASLPKLLSNVSNITQLAVRPNGALFLKSDGTVLAYGYLNWRSHSGPGEQPNVFKGAPLEELDAISGDICQIELISGNSFFLKKDGTVWKRIECGGSYAKVTQIPELTGIVRMFIGHNYFFIKEDHSIWGYGYNLFGSLGMGHSKPISTPTLLSNLPDIHQVYPGCLGYTFFITEDGSLLYSGRKDHLKKSNIPTLIPELAGVKQVLDVSHLRYERKLILILMDDGRILSMYSKEKLLELRDSDNTPDKIRCLNKWSNIHRQFSSKSGFFHQTNSHEALETQEKATNLTKQALERALQMEKEFAEQSDEKKSRCSIM